MMPRSGFRFAPAVLGLAAISVCPLPACGQEHGVRGPDASVADAAADMPIHGLDPRKALSQFNIDLWTEDDGLPQNRATALVQTPDGYLWAGTEEGLVRFDGVEFAVFGPSGTPAFPTPWVTTLWADPDGSLWIGTTGGLVRMADGEFEAPTAEHSLSHSHVLDIFRDRNGRLWVGTNGGGLNKLTQDGFDVVDVGDGLSNDYVVAVDQDPTGALWVGTVDGLNRIDSDGSIRIIRTEDGLAGNRIRDVMVTRDGSVWVATTDGGVTRIEDGHFSTYSTAEGLTSNHATSLHEDAAGAIWIGTQGGGLNRVYDGRITTLTTADHLPGDLVFSLGADLEGNIWMGLTGAGLARLRDGVFTTIGQPEGLAVDIALAILEDRDGSVWVGTAGGGLSRIHDDGITTFTPENGLPHGVVIALAEGTAGDIWVGTAGGGVSRIRDDQVRSFGEADGVVTSQVADILVDREGHTWFATHGSGLQRWRPSPARVYTRADGLPDDFVTAVHEHSDGTLWIGTQRGLARMDDGVIRPVPVGDTGQPVSRITALYEDGEGVLWVATSQGFARVRDGKATLYDDRAGSLGHAYHAVVDDSLGFLWLTSNEGISRLDKRDLDALDGGVIDTVPTKTFGRADGLRSAEANGGVSPAALRRSDGTLWFPTMKGAVVADPARTSSWRATPTPIIQRMIANDSVYSTRQPTTLLPGSRTFVFHFTAPTFSAPHDLNFRYMLEDFDPTWVESDTRRAAYYTNVPPGDYRFRVAVRRGDGPWVEAGGAVGLVLEPFFHERPAFLLLVALGLMGVAVGAYRFRVRSLTERQRVLTRVVAERERTEQALRLSEERLRLTLEAGRMGTWEWDAATRAITTSGTTAEILGFAPRSGPETLVRLRDMVAPDDLERLVAHTAGAAKDQDEFDLHFPLNRDDGERRYMEVRGRIFYSDQGEQERIAGVVSDITDFMNAQHELRRREEELRQAQKMEAVGRLAGGVAHDFNNLLTAISGRTELVLESLTRDHELREDVEEVRDAAARATNLTQQLLTFSRKQVYQPVVLDLNGVIGGVERMLRRIVRDNVIVDTHLDPALGHVHGDPGGIEQILLNLVVNAQDAMPEGGRIVVRTRNGRLDEDPAGAEARNRADAPPTHAILTVSDTGHGMSEETQESAFDPFFTTKPLGKGTGLGLATVYGIVQQSEGQIRVESEVGRGTRFDVYLPIVDAPVTDRELDRPRSKPDGGSETILLVEDELAVRSLARKVLERRGYTVLDASTGADALEISAAQNSPIDILVSDVVMPGIGGRELAERLQSLRPGMPVLLMSGYNEDEVLRSGVTGSTMEFIQKPFELDMLVNRIRRILDTEEVAT